MIQKQFIFLFGQTCSNRNTMIDLYLIGMPRLSRSHLGVSLLCTSKTLREPTTCQYIPIPIPSGRPDVKISRWNHSN